jgi:trimethylamine-N-oxide reductase (cytochrome c)
MPIAGIYKDFNEKLRSGGLAVSEDKKVKKIVETGGMTRRTTCTTAGPLFYWTKDGKVTRVAPMRFDPEEVDSWSVDVNGHTYKPPLKHPVLAWGLAGKQMLYSENRVKYPLKRVDWDPNGDRNTQNRGVSGYEPISWDEAYQILEDELKRVIDSYGSSSIAWSYSAHPEWGQFHYFFSDTYRFFHMLGATHWVFTPISWEGWAVGATFLWGAWEQFGILPAPNSLQDVSRHSETIVLWACDPVTKNVYAGIDTARIWQYWKNLGKKIIVIEPFNNDTAVSYADKWIPIIPGTDGAMACAIAYVWITEGTYDAEYVDSHVFGFDEKHLPEGVDPSESYKAYILGESGDGIAKTPEWAEEQCGVPARTIRDLAHLWAAGPTSVFCMMTGMCRREFADSTTRLLATLPILQGLGKPGVSVLGDLGSLTGPYDGQAQVGPPGYADGGMNLVLDEYRLNTKPGQSITFQKLPDCIENPPQKWHGGELLIPSSEDYFREVTYPAEGCSEVHFLWQRGSTVTNPPNVQPHYRAYKHESVEIYVVNAPWFDRDCRYADLVLPTTTTFERQDITEPSSIGQYVLPFNVCHRSAVYHQKGVEMLGESKTDMEIFNELSLRLGYGDYYMGGQTEDQLLRRVFDKTNIPMSFEDFKEKGYYVWPKLGKESKEIKQLQEFYEDPVSNPIDTPTGRFEFFSTELYERYGFNEGIPAVPHYIPEKEGKAESELRSKYPLQVTMAHPKFRFHGKYNDLTWLNENYKIVGEDGYLYEDFWMHTVDAEERGLVNGDILRVFNDRGSILVGLKITERLVPGTVWLKYGSWHDAINEGSEFIDRGGDGNMITNSNEMSPNHIGGAFNSTLVQVEKADIEGLKKQYPEGFAGKYSSWNWEAK